MERKVKRLCVSHAHLSAKRFDTEQRIDLNSELVSRGKPKYNDTLECLKTLLRHKLCVFVQRTLRTPARQKIFDATNDFLPARGVLPCVIRMPVDCLLENFSILAKEIFAWENGRIRITSVADRIQILTLSAKSPAGQLLRVIGSYVYDAKDDRNPATLFAGSSCGSVIRKEGEVDKGFARIYRSNALQRQTHEWILGPEKFAAGLRRKTLAPGSHSDPFSQDSGDVCYRHFMLTWRRGEKLIRKERSRIICNPARVSEKLGLTIQAVEVVGDILCEEVVGLLKSEYLISRIQ